MGEVVKMGTSTPARSQGRRKVYPPYNEFCERFDRLWDDPELPVDYREHIRTRVAGHPADLDEEAHQVLTFLNEKRAEVVPGVRGFLHTPANLKGIRARLREGMTMAELRAIVVIKCRQAAAGEFQPQYLRPATLFNAEKCNQYYGELGR